MHLVTARLSYDALSCLIDRMCPPQIKALAKLRLIIEHVYYEDIGPPALPFRSLPERKDSIRLVGLEDVEIVLSPLF
jgi:hypothetical protein